LPLKKEKKKPVGPMRKLLISIFYYRANMGGKKYSSKTQF